MTIYLVRHGETNSNIDRIVQTPDTPLSINGERQAQKFANAYSKLPISHILTSDYARARVTAQALQSQINAKFSTNTMLRERNFGDLRGVSHDDIPHNFMAEDFRPPNGETYNEFVLRVTKAWEYIVDQAKNEQGDLLIVTHGLVLRCIFKHILALPENILANIEIHNTCVTSVHQPNYVIIEQLCNIEHLLENDYANPQ